MAQHEAVLPAVILVPRHATSWVKFFDIANAFVSDGRFRPIMVLATVEMAQRAPECSRAGIPYVDLSTALQSAVRSNRPWLQALSSWLDRLAERAERLGNSLPVSLIRMQAMRQKLRVECSIFRKFFAEIHPVAVFVPGDRELSPVPPVLKAAGDAGIARLNAGFGSPGQAGLVHQRQPYARFGARLRSLPMLLSVIAARRWPRQLLHWQGAAYLFSPGWLLFALNAEGMMSANPWVQGGGFSDCLLQNSRLRVAELLRLGVPEGKIRLTGDPSLDRLYQSWVRRADVRRKLVSNHGLTTDDPIVVLSVPNDPEHGLGTFEEHLERMDRYFARLSAAGIRCLLSLHPKSNPSMYAELSQRWGHRIMASPLADFLPAADLFICSASTTILWAQLVGVPVLNLNYRNLAEDPDHTNLPGILEARDEDEMSVALAAWRAGKFDIGNLAEHAKQLRSDSMFDGAAGRRICDLVSELARKPQPPRARAI